jgi:hypothetical protein
MKTRLSRRSRVLVRLSFILAIASFSTSVAMESLRQPVSWQLPGHDRAEAEALAKRLAALSPEVDPQEAKRLANCAYATAYRLKQQYAMVWPPLFNNVLVNMGIKKRGLCFQWAQDLLVPLDKLKLKTLELHWGQARAETWQESNCIVVTAKNQPFETGIILDAWRHCGNLYWAPAATDEEPWVENSAYQRFIRATLEGRPRLHTGSRRPPPRKGRRSLADHGATGTLISAGRNQADGAASTFSP